MVNCQPRSSVSASSVPAGARQVLATRGQQQLLVETKTTARVREGRLASTQGVRRKTSHLSQAEEHLLRQGPPRQIYSDSSVPFFVTCLLRGNCVPASQELSLGEAVCWGLGGVNNLEPAKGPGKADVVGI